MLIPIFTNSCMALALAHPKRPSGLDASLMGLETPFQKHLPAPSSRIRRGDNGWIPRKSDSSIHQQQNGLAESWSSAGWQGWGEGARSQASGLGWTIPAMLVLGERRVDLSGVWPLGEFSGHPESRSKTPNNGVHPAGPYLAQTRPKAPPKGPWFKRLRLGADCGVRCLSSAAKSGLSPAGHHSIST